MIRRGITRSPGTRTTRMDPRERRLESLAAEFALLAQRRARMTHQVDLLAQQSTAATMGLAKLQARMAWLAQQMDALDPALRDDPMPPPPPPPPAPVKAAPAAFRHAMAAAAPPRSHARPGMGSVSRRGSFR